MPRRTLMKERRAGAVASLSWRGEGVGEVEAPHYSKEGLGWLRKSSLFGCFFSGGTEKKNVKHHLFQKKTLLLHTHSKAMSLTTSTTRENPASYQAPTRRLNTSVHESPFSAGSPRIQRKTTVYIPQPPKQLSLLYNFKLKLWKR